MGVFNWRGRRVQRSFEQQVIEALDPLSYDLTRSKGRIEFIVRKPMAERLQEIEEIHRTTDVRRPRIDAE